jgi:glutaredoxin 3
MLQVFSATWCPACKQVKQFLKQHNIPFEEKDIDTDKTAYDTLSRLQLRSIPVIYLDDDNYVVGADQKKILELAKK